MKYNRRDFLKISYSASMGLMIGVALPIKNRLIGENIVDYLWHLPNNIIDRSYKPTVVSAENDRIVTIDITVSKHSPSRRRGLPYLSLIHI